MGIRIQRSGADFSARAIRAAAQEAAAVPVEQWHEVFLPQHFTTSAPAKYGYAPRTARYMRRKARVKKHQRPLEFSGESKEAAMYDIRFARTVIAGRPAAYVAMAMPGYFVQARGADPHDKPAELTRTTPQEEDILGETVARVFLDQLGLHRITSVA